MARIPDRNLFLAGIDAYEKYEGRGIDYFTALRDVQAGWGQPDRMADGVWVLLNRWHRDFYRFAPAECYPGIRREIATCIGRNADGLKQFRDRTIDSLAARDEAQIKLLFTTFESAASFTNKARRHVSPVAAAKTIHLMAPAFLPLWDNPIAGRFGCIAMNATDYVSFCRDIQEHADVLKNYVPIPDDRTLIKRIDEFNYAAYTKGWVPRP